MPETRIHLIRHGEVFNPEGVLYGRLPGFSLSETGHKMARLAAETLQAQGRTIGKIVASPLQRTQESAAPIAELFQLPIISDERIIEASNYFEGNVVSAKFLLRPKNLVKLFAPWKPSWGEPFSQMYQRMLQAITEHHATVESGDLVLVSHQAPIWTVHRATAGKSFIQNPKQRRCQLSSITTFSFNNQNQLTELSYLDPAADLRAENNSVSSK